MNDDLDIDRTVLADNASLRAEIALQALNDGDLALAISAAPSWAGGEGTTVAGEVVHIGSGQFDDGSKTGFKYPIVTLKTFGGLVRVHAIPQTLREGLIERAPQVGDKLRFLNLGDVTSKKRGVTYHLTVLVPDETVVKNTDWTDFA